MTTQQNQEYDKILALINSIAKTQKETSKQMKETDKKFAETDKMLSAKFAETDEQMKKTDEQMKETNEQIKETDKIVKELTKNIQGVNKSIGEDTETFFYTSLQRKPILGNIKFDFVDRNISRTKDLEELQIDVFLENGKSVGLVEVKNKVTKKVFKQIENQIEKFPRLHPAFKNYKVYGAIAGKVFPKHLQQEALQKGYFVLVQQGDHVEVMSPK